ncbi:MAG TPA: hypothetical protein VFU47_05960, partial [Armatimonadota bacterium]|nr:hypothetical protein [Armatimonadota bacterium]
LIPALWSVNGVASILGSVAAMAIAKFWGYSGALMAGAGCYLVAWAAFALVRGAGDQDGVAAAGVAAAGSAA